MENETADFRGLLYNPTLESEVVMLFSLLIPHLADSFVIEEGDRGVFPDCLALRNGQKVGIEFEVFADRFFEHKHHEDDNLTKCNIIVCWKNNIPDTTQKDGIEILKVKGHEIKIMSLDKLVKNLQETTPYRFIKHGERPDIFRVGEERFFEQLEKIKPKNLIWIKQLYEQLKQSEDFEVEWGGGKRWSTMKFLVKKWGVSPMSVYGNGSVEICYQGNPYLSHWELPQETQTVLRQIFKRYKHKWHYIPLKTETDLDKVRKALKILTEHSKRFDII